MENFKDVISMAKTIGTKTISVAAAHDEDVLKAVKAAYDEGIVQPILVGNGDQIKRISDDIGLDIRNIEIIHLVDLEEISFQAVELVSSKRADILMKGMVDTSVILKAVLDKKIGLRTGRTLSHAAVFFVEKYHKMLILTDAAMNIAPDLEKKRQILENAVSFAHSLGLHTPKCAVICAKEKADASMPHTVDAAELVKMNETGIIGGCIVGGPFALDNAISKEAALHKGIVHPVAGEADILLMPTIEAGNVLYKSLAFLAQSESAGIILGAAAPFVLTSRADSDISKLNSIALSVLHSRGGKQ